MPRTLNVTYPISLEELEEAARRAEKPSVRVRFLVVRLVKQGRSATEAARELGLGETRTCIWVNRFNTAGPAGLQNQWRAPRRPRLSSSRVEEFKARVRAGAQPGDGVSVLRGKDFQRILKAEFQAPLSLRGTYFVLHRLRFASLVPRPQHPASDPVAQAEFKKNCPRC
jgi:transposase